MSVLTLAGPTSPPTVPFTMAIYLLWLYTYYGSTDYGQADFAAYGIALTFTPCALREVARRAATQGTGA